MGSLIDTPPQRGGSADFRSAKGSRGRLWIWSACLAGLALGLAAAGAADWYVAPEGGSSGRGTLARPYSLATALSGRVGRAGDTFWLRGGTYTLGHVETQVAGAPGQPLTFRQMPGERARVDGSLTIWNSIGYVVFRDFELFSSDANRVSSQTGVGFNPTDIRLLAGISCFSPNFSFINLVIHDQTRHGIYMSQTSDHCLIYGCIIYNNGWCGPDNAEGHSFYIQGSSGTREIAENLLFNSTGYGLHVYDCGGDKLTGMLIEGNVSFNAGALEQVRKQRDWTVGVDAPSTTCDEIVFRDNLGYHPPGLANYPQAQLGRQGINGGVIITGNYLPMGLALNNWQRAIVSSNFFGASGEDGIVTVDQTQVPLAASWNGNTYAGSGNDEDFQWNGSACGFADWKSRTGHDAHSAYAIGKPTGTKVFVRPNRYEAGRANIVVYNWDNLDSVAVEVSGALPPGMNYEVRNAEDYFAPPVLSGTYDGQPLRLPMNGLSVARVNGALITPPPTGPTFNVFVLLPASGTPTVNALAAVPGPKSQTPVSGTSATPTVPSVNQPSSRVEAAASQRVGTYGWVGRMSLVLPMIAGGASDREATPDSAGPSWESPSRAEQFAPLPSAQAPACHVRAAPAADSQIGGATGCQLQISWPRACSGYTLQWQDGPCRRDGWRDVTDRPRIAGDQCVLTQPWPKQERFYRWVQK